MIFEKRQHCTKYVKNEVPKIGFEIEVRKEDTEKWVRKMRYEIDATKLRYGKWIRKIVYEKLSTEKLGTKSRYGK